MTTYPGDTALSEAEQLTALTELFAEGAVAVLTGAGVSTDSGIPDYRGKGTPPRTPMRVDQFMESLAYRRRFWAGAAVNARRTTTLAPNAGHRALAALEATGHVNAVITQNVDGLHRAAGSHSLVELHGTGAMVRCVDCGREWPRTVATDRFEALNPGFTDRHLGATIAPDGDASVNDSRELDTVRVPECPACGGIIRPNVVYFGEHVPTQVFARAAELTESATALVIAGSSLAVNTGMRLVHRAERLGLPIAVINRGPTAIDTRAALRLRVEGGTSEWLTAVVTRLQQ